MPRVGGSLVRSDFGVRVYSAGDTGGVHVGENAWSIMSPYG